MKSKIFLLCFFVAILSASSLPRAQAIRIGEDDPHTQLQPEREEDTNPCKIELPEDQDGRAHSIPNYFPVRDCLTAPGQQESKFVPKTGEHEPVLGGTAMKFITSAVDLFVKIVGSLSLLAFVLGGLLVIVSEGKDDRLDRGKSAMLFALIGLALTLFASVIVSLVQSILF